MKVSVYTMNRLESAVRWAVRWRNVGFSPSEHILYEDRMPVMFRTRAEARAYIDQKFGYIRTRKDLRTWPHCWRIPQPIRAKVVPDGSLFLKAKKDRSQALIGAGRK